MTTQRTLKSAWIHPLTDRVIDLGQQEVRVGSTVHRLSWQEVLVLDYLIAAAGQPVRRGELLALVWGYSADANTRAVDRAIARIRAKIERDSRNPEHLLTLHGVGYRWAATEPATTPSPTPSDELLRACTHSSLVALVGPRATTLRWLARHESALAEVFDPLDLEPVDPATLTDRALSATDRVLWAVGCDRRPDAMLLAQLDRMIQRRPQLHLLLCCPKAPVDAETHCTWIGVPTEPAAEAPPPDPADTDALPFVAAFPGGAPADAIDTLLRARPALSGFAQRGVDAGWLQEVPSPSGTRYQAHDAGGSLAPDLARALVDWALGRCALDAAPAGVSRLEQALLQARDLALDADRPADAATIAARLDDVHGRYHVVNASAAVLERTEPWTAPWRSAIARAPMPAIQATAESLDRTPADLFRWAADHAREAGDSSTTVAALQRLAGTRILAGETGDALELYQRAQALADASEDEVCAIDAGVRSFALHTALGRTSGLHRLDDLQRRAANLRLWHVVAEMIASRALHDANHGDLARGARALQDALPVMERNGAHHTYFTLATHASLMRQALGRVDGELALLDSLLVEADQRGSWYTGAFVHAARGTLLAQLGEWGMAQWAWERAQGAGVPMIDSFVAFERAFFTRLRGESPTSLPPIRGDEDQHKADFLAFIFPEEGSPRQPGPPNQYRYHGVRRWAQILVRGELEP